MTVYIDKIAWILIKDRKFLTTLSKGKDTWYIPGGKREGDESDEETLTREIKEELSVDLVKDTFEPYGVFEAQAHGKMDGIVVRMTCYTADYDGELMVDNEIEKYEFMGYEGKEVSSPVDKLIIEDMKSKGLVN